MSDKTVTPRGAVGWALATTGVTLAAWWWQSRSREAQLEERTRTRLRSWGHR